MQDTRMDFRSVCKGLSHHFFLFLYWWKSSKSLMI